MRIGAEEEVEEEEAMAAVEGNRLEGGPVPHTLFENSNTPHLVEPNGLVLSQ